jgi:hypothetical protein
MLELTEANAPDLTLQQVAELLGMRIELVRAHVMTGSLPIVRPGPQSIRVRFTDYLEFRDRTRRQLAEKAKQEDSK